MICTVVGRHIQAIKAWQMNCLLIQQPLAIAVRASTVLLIYADVNLES